MLRALLLVDLLKEISLYYTDFSEGLNNASYEDLSLYSLNKFREYMIEFGFPLMTGGIEKPQNSDELHKIISDRKFQGILRNAEYNRTIQISGFNDALKRVRNILVGLDEYFSTNDQ